MTTQAQRTVAVIGCGKKNALFNFNVHALLDF